MCGTSRLRSQMRKPRPRSSMASRSVCECRGRCAEQCLPCVACPDIFAALCEICTPPMLMALSIGLGMSHQFLLQLLFPAVQLSASLEEILVYVTFSFVYIPTCITISTLVSSCTLLFRQLGLLKHQHLTAFEWAKGSVALSPPSACSASESMAVAYIAGHRNHQQGLAQLLNSIEASFKLIPGRC